MLSSGGGVNAGVLDGVAEPELFFTELEILLTCSSAKAKAEAHLSKHAKTRGDFVPVEGSEAALVSLAGHSETATEGADVSSLEQMSPSSQYLAV